MFVCSHGSSLLNWSWIGQDLLRCDFDALFLHLLDLSPSFLILFELSPCLAAIGREEPNFKALDIFLQLVTDVVIEAINQVLLKIADNSGLGVAILNSTLLQERVDFAPRLRLSVLSDHTIEKMARYLNLLVQDLALESIAHAQHCTLVFICFEFEQSCGDFLSHPLIKRELTLFLTQLIENLFVLLELHLGREDFEADEMVVDSGLELVPLFLAVDNLSQFMRIFLEQISNQTIIEFLLDALELCALLFDSQ